MLKKRRHYAEDFKPSKYTINFFLWMLATITEENKTAKAHIQLIDHIVQEGNDKVMGECFRGFAKTTLITQYYLLWCITEDFMPSYGGFDNVLIIMDTTTQVSDLFEELIGTIENNPKLKTQLKIERTKLKDNFRLDLTNIASGKKYYISGRSTGQKLRGMIRNKKRPQVCIIDDLENDEAVETKEQRLKTKKWFFRTLLPALHPKHRVIYLGTPLHEDALLVNLKHGSFSCLSLPIMDNFKREMREEDWRNVVSAWDDRFPVKKLKEMYRDFKEDGEIDSFYQEYMLEVIPEENRLFNLEDVQKYSKIKKIGYVYIFVDPALSEKEGADRTAIVVVMTTEEGELYLLDGFIGQIPADVILDKVFEFAITYKADTIFFEDVAFQSSLKTFFNRMMIESGRFFNVELIKRRKAKLSVFKAFSILVKSKKFYIPNRGAEEYISELFDEMNGVTQSKIYAKHDDALDAISMVALVELIYKDKEGEEKQIGEEIKTTYTW